MFVSGFNIKVSFQSTFEEHYFDIKERDFVTYNDIQFDEKINNDTSPLTHECVKKYISGLQFDEMIDDETAKYLKENSPTPGRFYTIPKIHKQGHPGRPIVSSNRQKVYSRE